MATLIGLPPELHVQIANNLDNTALLALRQTDRQLEQNSHDVFVERFFRRRSHLFTLHSLDVLQQISGSSLARHVKFLSLVACPLLPRTEIEITPWQLNDSHQLINLAPQDSSNLVEIFSNFKKVGAARRIRLFTGYSLANLREMPNGISTILLDEVEADIMQCLESAYGFANVRRFFIPDVPCYVMHKGGLDHVFKHTLPALLEAGLDVNALTLGFDGCEGLTQNDQSAALVDYRLGSSFWQNITELKLDLNFDEFAQHSSSPWPEIVAVCPRLTRFSVQVMQDVPSDFEKSLGRSLQSTSITSIKIQGTDMYEDNLNDLLSPIRLQLVELDLDVCRFNPGSWNRICLMLSRMSLHKVRLYKLQDWDMERGEYFGDDDSDESKAEGEQAVKEMLLRLAEQGHGILEEDD